MTTVTRHVRQILKFLGDDVKDKDINVISQVPVFDRNMYTRGRPLFWTGTCMIWCDFKDFSYQKM